MEIVKELSERHSISGLHKRRRMVVLARGDGRFSYAEQYHYITDVDYEVVAEGGATLPPEGIFATADDAEAEALHAAIRLGPELR